MHFGLSREQQELDTTLRTLLARHADSAAVRAATESAGGHDANLWQLLCEQVGVAAFAIPEEHGGAGFTLFETGIALEALGHCLAPTPLLAGVLASSALLASDDAAACADLLPGIAAGEVATLAWSSVTDGLGSRAGVKENDGRLTGRLPAVLHGDTATVLLVAAETDDGLGLFAVDPEAASRHRRPGMDTTLRFAEVTLDAVPARRIGSEATDTLARAHRAGTVATACLQLGGAQRALDDTVAHCRERVQFGRPIGSFQALKHRMADMLVEVELLRSTAWAATHAVSTDAPDAPLLAAAAGSRCSEGFFRVAAEAVQLHGGLGITWEHDVSMIFKRAQALQQLFGLPHQHRALVEL